MFNFKLVNKEKTFHLDMKYKLVFENFNHFTHFKNMYRAGGNWTTQKGENAHVFSPRFSLVGFNNAFNTIKLYKQGCVQTEVLSGNHKTKSAVLFS